jgi:iron complex outermembrane receptor protein
MKSGMKTLARAVAQAVSAGVAMTVVATPVLAQQAQRIEKIEVTGSNIKRIEGETALPVTVISREDIARSGAMSTNDLLEKVVGNSGGGFSLANGVGDSNSGRTTASLRGLGETNTLVLLNGRRLSTFAFTTGGGGININQIPLAAVERVEILKDGASAIYGTDAIGGVINFILRKDFTGIEASATGTHTEHGGGNERRYTATLGFGDLSKQRFNVMASFDYSRQDPLAASQRKEFTGTGIRPDLGFVSISSRTWPANFTFNGRSYNLSAANGCMPDQGSYHVSSNGQPAPLQRNCVQDFSAVLDIFPKVERKGFFARGAFQITNNHEAYVEYNKQQTESTFAISETPAVTAGGPFAGVPYTYPAGGRYYPGTFTDATGASVTPTGPLTFSWRVKAGGRRTDRVDTDEDRVVAGLQGVIAGWDYNTGVMQARSKVVDNYIDGYLRDSVMRAAIATGNVDVFSGRPLDAAGQALVDSAKILQAVRTSETKVKSFDGKISKELTELRAGPLALALGFDIRKEELHDIPDAAIFASGDILGGGGDFQEQRGDRKVTAFFGELSVPIMRNLEATFAVRHDHYSDFGNTTNPKVAIRWTPVKEWLVRASYSTGFRAPTLSDLYLPNFIGNTSGSHDDPLRCPGGTPIGAFVDTPNECDIQFNSQNGGNRNLQPEKSRQWSLGTLFEPSPMFSIGTDFWTIRRRNSILQIGDGSIFEQYGAADPLNANGYFVRYGRDASGGCTNDIPGSPATPASVPCAIFYVVQVQQNLGNFNVTGQDVSVSVRLPYSITLRGEGTYIYSYRYQQAKDAPYLSNVGVYTTDNGAIPRWKHYITLNWRSGPLTATLAQNFVLGFADDTTLGNAPRRVASYETYDLQAGWDGWKGLSLIAGIRNVLDRNPPTSAKSQGFVQGYDESYADPRGRTYYATLKFSFK